jgi:hypothetical protein
MVKPKNEIDFGLTFLQEYVNEHPPTTDDTPADEINFISTREILETISSIAGPLYDAKQLSKAMIELNYSFKLIDKNFYWLTRSRSV